MINAKIEMKDLFFCNNAYDACVQSKGLIIATEWNEFRGIDLTELKGLMKSPIVLDTKNILSMLKNYLN